MKEPPPMQYKQIMAAETTTEIMIIKLETIK